MKYLLHRLVDNSEKTDYSCTECLDDEVSILSRTIFCGVIDSSAACVLFSLDNSFLTTGSSATDAATGAATATDVASSALSGTTATITTAI